MTAGGHVPGDRAQDATPRSRPTRPPRRTSTRTARCRCPTTSAQRAHAAGEALGWGAGYQYPHDFAGHYVREEYLPEALAATRYYQPSDSGHEADIAARLAKLRATTRKKR